jgi:hypothetical protein
MMGISRVRSTCAHQLGKVEAVQFGHLHVDEGQRHLVLEQQFKGALARFGLEDLSVAGPEQGLERQEIFRAVVNQQEFGLIAHPGP